MKNDEPDTLDGLLDRALVHYSSQEPLAGIEQRVMNRVRAESGARRVGWGRWALAAGALAVAAMLVTAVSWKKPVRHEVVARKTAIPVPPAARAAAHEPAMAATFRKKAARSKGRVAPISQEERALLALAMNAPEALLDIQRKSAEPIYLEAIEIQPLRSNDANDDSK